MCAAPASPTHPHPLRTPQSEYVMRLDDEWACDARHLAPCTAKFTAAHMNHSRRCVGSVGWVGGGFAGLPVGARCTLAMAWVVLSPPSKMLLRRSPCVWVRLTYLKLMKGPHVLSTSRNANVGRFYCRREQRVSHGSECLSSPPHLCLSPSGLSWGRVSSPHPHSGLPPFPPGELLCSAGHPADGGSPHRLRA